MATGSNALDRLSLNARETPLLRSDLEEQALTAQEREDLAESFLEQAQEILKHAEKSLHDIEQENVLGSAILRSAEGLADGIGQLAHGLENQTDDERKALAQACLQDVQENSLLLKEEGVVCTRQEEEHLERMTNLSESEMTTALQAAASLLRDVESTLRAMERDEAEEIADVALTVAHLFLASLQSFISTVSPEDLLSPGRAAEGSSPTIEILDDENELADDNANTKRKSNNKSTRRDRLRVLWPPLGKAAESCLDMGKRAALDRPIVAVALGITLWPAAVATAMVGGPLILLDGFIQDLYKQFEDAPLVVGLERGAAHLYQSGRLMLVSGKLVGRQSLRILSRQVERHGGAGKIAQNAGGFCLDRISHPVETLGMACNTVAWGTGVVRDLWEQLNDQENSAEAHSLQQ